MLWLVPKIRWYLTYWTHIQVDNRLCGRERTSHLFWCAFFNNCSRWWLVLTETILPKVSCALSLYLCVGSYLLTTCRCNSTPLLLLISGGLDKIFSQMSLSLLATFAWAILLEVRLWLDCFDRAEILQTTCLHLLHWVSLKSIKLALRALNIVIIIVKEIIAATVTAMFPWKRRHNCITGSPLDTCC